MRLAKSIGSAVLPGTARSSAASGTETVSLDGSDRALPTRSGSNQFSLTKIVADEERAIVVATDIGGRPAHDGMGTVVAGLDDLYH